MTADAPAGIAGRRTLPRMRIRDLRAGRLARRAAAMAWRAAPVLGAGLAASIPVLVSTGNAVGDGWVPAGDDGIIATRGWDVLTSHTPNVGQYSEAGLVIAHQIVHSPGPMLYWLIALPARFGGVSSLALTMGVANTIAIVGTVALARRRGGLVLMFATAIGIALMCQSLPSEALHDIWNPAAGLFPFLLLVFAGWSVACGDVVLLPLVALVASFVVQTHLMYAPPTAVVLGVAAIGLGGRWIERRRLARAGHRRVRRRAWPWLAAAVALAAACWTPPIIDELENSPGNLTLIVRTVEHRGQSLGSRIGWNAVVRSIGITPWWLYVPSTAWDRKYDVGALTHPGAGAPSSPGSGRTLSAIAILAALGVVALFASLALRWDVAGAALIGLGMCAAIGAEAASNPADPLLAGTLGYTMWWGSVLGFFVDLVLAWSLWLALSTALAPRVRRAVRPHAWRLPARARRLALAGATIVCLGATAGAGAAAAATQRRDSHVYEYAPTRTLAAALDRVLPRGATVNYTFKRLSLGTQPIEPALRFFMVRHGDRVLAQGSLQRMGAYYELYQRPYQWLVLLAQEPYRAPHGLRLVARVRVTDGWGTQTLAVWAGRRGPGPRTATLRP
jgi:hypothetical protein